MGGSQVLATAVAVIAVLVVNSNAHIERRALAVPMVVVVVRVDQRLVTEIAADVCEKISRKLSQLPKFLSGPTSHTHLRLHLN
jgi:hypothetical protein